MSINNSNILITGGTGTVGKHLLDTLVKEDVNHIYILSRDEQKQDMLINKFSNNPKITFIIGDIRNYNSVHSAMKNINIIFHTAAMKIVKTCEINPYEAFYTNILGTDNVIKAAIDNKVDRVIFTSSDKAANPTSVMGISKLFSERLISNANFINGSNTKFTSVRFGNIIGSRGGVLDLFIKQIQTQDFVTVTHKDMSRFVLSIDEAVNFLLESAELSLGGEVLIKKMPVMRIYDLAKVLINYYAPKFSKNPKDMQIKITQKQPVEKLHEELVSIDEVPRTIEFNDMYCILPTIYKEKWTNSGFPLNKKIHNNISSDKFGFYMTEMEIFRFLMDNKIIES